MNLPLVGLAAALIAAPIVAAAQPLRQPWRDRSPHQIRWVTTDTSVRLEVLD